MNRTMLAKLILPEGVTFGDLQLKRDVESGGLWYDVDAVHRFCEGNNIDARTLLEEDEDGLCELIHRWHELHVEQGGRRDDVQSLIMAEIEAESLTGMGIVSHGSPLLQ